MSSFPTWLFGLLELGRCGMSPRTSEGITRLSRRRCAALANAPRQREPLSVRPRRLVVHHVVVVTRCCLPDHRATRRAEPAESPRDMHWRRAPASLGGPWQGATRRPTARSATAHAREGSSEERCGMGAALVADRRLDPAALHPDGHLDRLRVAGPVQDGVGGGLAVGAQPVVM